MTNTTEPTTVTFNETTGTYAVEDAVEGAIPGVDFEVHGDLPVEPIDPATQVDPGDPDAANQSFKIERLSQFKQSIENDLQPLIMQAAANRKVLDGAKTTTKKAFYTKKFKKTQDLIMRYVSTLQQIEELIRIEGTKDADNDTSTEE